MERFWQWIRSYSNKKVRACYMENVHHECRCETAAHGQASEAISAKRIKELEVKVERLYEAGTDCINLLAISNSPFREGDSRILLQSAYYDEEPITATDNEK